MSIEIVVKVICDKCGLFKELYFMNYSFCQFNRMGFPSNLVDGWRDVEHKVICDKHDVVIKDQVFLTGNESNAS